MLNKYNINQLPFISNATETVPTWKAWLCGRRETKSAGQPAHLCNLITTLIDSYFWFGLMLNVPVNNFSVMSGRSHRFLGITSTFFFWGGGICLAQGHNTATPVGLEPPTSGSGVRGVNHRAPLIDSMIFIVSL